MTPLLDRLARATGGASTGDDVGDRFARDAFLRRGFAGILALTTLGSSIRSPIATAASCPRGSLDNCIDAAYRTFRASVVNTCDKESSFAARFECLRDFYNVQRDLRRTCERRCPKPKPKRPSRSKPTKTTRNAKQPPPLPPNPYDDGGLCATCQKANGLGSLCCYGGELPGGYCGCIAIGPDGKPAATCAYIGCGG